jgi:uncharacterized protein
MKYFRVYPWGLQLILFLLMIITMIGFGASMLYLLLPKLTGYSFQQTLTVTEQSPMALIKAALVALGASSLFMFLIPAFLFAYLTHPQPAEYLGLRPAGKPIQWILVIFVMLGAMPLLQLIQSLIGMINFGDAVKKQQATNDHMMNAFLVMPDFWAFIRVFVVMAIVPAMGEEFFFRGVLMRFAKKRTTSMVAPVIFTAIIFSYSHTNIYGYISIFIAGVLLAVIYNLTGSLWCSILAHMCFNGFQIILGYFGSTNSAIKSFLDNTSVPYYYVIGGAIVFSISFYLLLKNKTPLPENWTDDFPPEEKKDDWDFMAKS